MSAQQLDLGRTTGAEFSPCRTYRYALWRIWDDDKGRVVWVMLNPSTADEHADDPTIRRCERFAKKWGYGSITVVNLFALRASDPRDLYGRHEPVGPGNDEATLRHVRGADLVMVAWGNHGDYRGRAADVLARLLPAGVWCLAQNGGGEPAHPLYRPRDAVPLPYRARS